MTCVHEFKIFKDPKLQGKNYLSFYCKKCLMLVKVEKTYINEQEQPQQQPQPQQEPNRMAQAQNMNKLLFG